MIASEELRRALAAVDRDTRDLLALHLSGAFAAPNGHAKLTLDALDIRAAYLGGSLQHLYTVIVSLNEQAEREDAEYWERQAATAPFPQGRGSVLDDREQGGEVVQLRTRRERAA